MFEGAIRKYSCFALDYSFFREFSGMSYFRDLFTRVSDGSCEVYVGRDFKLLHHCVTHQAADKDAPVSSALRDFFGVLINLKRIHEISAVTSREFLNEISKIDDICLITTRTGILFKRMFDQKLKLDKPIILVSKTDVEVFANSDECYRNVSEIKISPLASKTGYLDAHVFCNVGDVVQTAGQKNITLASRISNGAEGMIFKTNDPRIVAKIYHRGVITPLRWSKLTRMAALGINTVEICWPLDLLFYHGVPVGYTMRFGKGSTLSNIFDGPDAITNAFPDWKRIDIVETLLILLEKYLYLHMHDIVIGDIQLKNVLLYSSASCYLIDMDSIQVGNLPCPVGTEEFTPPELWGRNFSDFLRTLKMEDYCIAMLVFSVLFCGLHPYARRNGKDTLREEILERNFPYKLDNSNTEEIPVGGYNFIWEYLPDNIRRMLYDVFALGISHEAIEWYSVIVEYKEKLVARRFEDPEAYKVFPKMDYKPTTSEVSQNVKNINNNSFKSRLASATGTNPFAAVANNNMPDPSLVATNKSFYAARAKKEEEPAPTGSDEGKAKGGLFSRFGKRK